jgi:hypothetical protein
MLHELNFTGTIFKVHYYVYHFTSDEEHTTHFLSFTAATNIVFRILQVTLKLHAALAPSNQNVRVMRTLHVREQKMLTHRSFISSHPSALKLLEAVRTGNFEIVL